MPNRYILCNILLQYETVEWAKESNQDLIFLKLDFIKAYDVVAYKFLFSVMRKLGKPEVFIQLVFLLLHDASALVILNGKTTDQFPIHRGVHLHPI